jgi:hypothetical protein
MRVEGGLPLLQRVDGMDHALNGWRSWGQTTVRWELRDLLDEPDELLPAVLEDASVTG